MSIIIVAVTSFMLALSGALVPGPLFTITVGESLKRGFVAGPLIILGHGLLELLIIFLLVFEVTPYLSGEHTRLAISIVGGVILVIMGIALIKDAGKSGLDYYSGKKKTGLHPVLSGIIGSISNPYWLIWWVTIGLGYLVSSLKFGVPGVIAFFAGHLSADLAWYSIVSFTVSRGRKVIGQKGYRNLLYLCGLFLVVFGGWFITGV